MTGLCPHRPSSRFGFPPPRDDGRVIDHRQAGVLRLEADLGAEVEAVGAVGLDAPELGARVVRAGDGVDEDELVGRLRAKHAGGEVCPGDRGGGAQGVDVAKAVEGHHSAEDGDFAIAGDEHLAFIDIAQRRAGVAHFDAGFFAGGAEGGLDRDIKGDGPRLGRGEAQARGAAVVGEPAHVLVGEAAGHARGVGLVKLERAGEVVGDVERGERVVVEDSLFNLPRVGGGDIRRSVRRTDERKHTERQETLSHLSCSSLDLD